MMTQRECEDAWFTAYCAALEGNRSSKGGWDASDENVQKWCMQDADSALNAFKERFKGEAGDES